MAHHHLSSDKAKSLKLAKQAEGTIGRVVEMVEKDTYCPEIIQQVDSVIGLLKSTKRQLLAGHLDACLPARLSENKAKTVQELLKIYNLSS